MKINLKQRLKNKTFLLAIAGTVILLIQQLGFELPANTETLINTVVTLLVALGVVIDPTTEGINDSERVLNIEKEGVEEYKKHFILGSCML